MKKLVLLLAVLFSVNVAMAQFDFCLGPKIGYQTQSLSYKKLIFKKVSKTISSEAFLPVSLSVIS